MEVRGTISSFLQHQSVFSCQSSLVPLAGGVVVFHVRGLHVEGRFAGGRQLLVCLHADCAGDGMTCRKEE